MEEEQSKRHKRPLHLDWTTLLDGGDSDAPPPELLVKPSSDPAAMASDGLDLLTDHELRESIRSKTKTLETAGKKLPDRGAKLCAIIKRCEEELSRRKVKAHREEVDEDQRPRQATSTSAVGVSNESRQENLSSQALPQSSFASCFVKKMEDDTDRATDNAFSKEMSHFKHCNNQRIRENGEPRGRKKLRSYSRQKAFQCPSNLSKRATFNDDKRRRASFTFSQHNIGKDLPRSFTKKKDASSVIQPDGLRSRKGQPIVLDDDDDEPRILEKSEEENKLAEYLKEAKIYYPSRDDPECVEVCYPDIDCLAPEGYLTSTIMNFYIRYLKQQASLTNRSLSDYHFFNTFFYKKLKEAVSHKRSDRETFFVKFRRWWKGINIFQKAYILIPIHEDLHWSLIIICIPDKEDESGPIILHLDSLGLHSSKSVFDNIKSYLIEERNYLGQEGVPSDVSISERIWNCLPRRIEAHVIPVPQQKNEYDCGLFVLYFIERFIDEAPERLKKKDLEMFGKRWFKPEEASSLRVKIRKLLVEELQNSIQDNCSIPESSPQSSADTATECVDTATECVDTAKDSFR